MLVIAAVCGKPVCAAKATGLPVCLLYVFSSVIQLCKFWVQCCVWLESCMCGLNCLVGGPGGMCCSLRGGWGLWSEVLL